MSTTRSVASPMSATRSITEPYLGYSPREDVLSLPDQKVSPGQVEESHPPPKPSRFEGIISAYGAVSSILGFKEKYSLVFFTIFGGALAGFCLARTMMMSPHIVRFKTVPGEWYWYKQSLYKPNIFLHIYLTIIGGITVIFQFIPAIRRRVVILHRINGYFSLFLLIPGNICGAIVARRAFGGELNVQAAFYILGSMIVFSALMGLSNVRQTRKHRKWMLRTVAYFASPITARFATIAGRHIVSIIGTYYAIWRCDEVLFTIKDRGVMSDPFPQCVAAGSNAENVYFAIRAEWSNYPFGFASSVRVTFGMALWTAMIIHIFGVEIYIQKTEVFNAYRRGFVLERKDEGSSWLENLDTQSRRSG